MKIERSAALWLAMAACASSPPIHGAETNRVYENRLVPLTNGPPLLADHPEFVQPIEELGRYEAPAIVNDARADLHVRA